MTDSVAARTGEGSSAEAVESAWRRVQLARHPQRPRTLDLVPLMFEGDTALDFSWKVFWVTPVAT